VLVLRRRVALTAVTAFAALVALTACSPPASDLRADGGAIVATEPAANPEGVAEAASSAPETSAADSDTAGAVDESAPAEEPPTPPDLEPEVVEGQTVTVERVVDGDTVYTSNGAKIRLIGYDTPEHGECGFDEAKQLVTELVLGKTVTLVNPSSVLDQDKYDRWLRYVNFDGQDLGTAVLTAGMAHARYDGLDGYDSHSLQDSYRSIDAATAHICE